MCKKLTILRKNFYFQLSVIAIVIILIHNKIWKTSRDKTTAQTMFLQIQSQNLNITLDLSFIR